MNRSEAKVSEGEAILAGRRANDTRRREPSPRLSGVAVSGLALLAGLSLSVAACGGARSLPPPRPIIIHSGVRILADSQRLNQIDEWLRVQLESIDEDPTFLIKVTPRDTAPLPWDGLIITGDTAEVAAPRDVPDSGPVLMIYAHLHLMERMGRLEEWLPEVINADGWGRERAFVQRLCDAWLYARAIADAPPFPALDELLYACEFGYRDAFLLTARAQRFREEREEWVRENPDAPEEYRRWFRETFGEEPPGWSEPSRPTPPAG